MIFDSHDRSRKTPKSFAESEWAFLDSSATVGSTELRELLEDWFSNFPDSGKKDWLAAFRSGDDGLFRACGFELFVNQLLTRLGYETKDHQPGGDKGGFPDFLASFGDYSDIYVEATISGIGSTEEQAEHRRQNVALDQLQRIETDSFFIQVNIRSRPTTQPRVGPMRSTIESWLASLDPDQVDISNLRSLRGLPAIEINRSGWDLEIHAIPKKPEARGKISERPVGALFHGVSRDSSTEDLNTSVLRKASRYGDLRAPFVVAVSPTSFTMNDEDYSEALFGTVSLVVDESGNASNVRIPNGVWRGKNGIRYTRLSAVLTATDVQPWTYGARQIRLWLNPDAIHPVVGPLLDLPKAEIIDGYINRLDGVSVYDLLELDKYSLWAR